MSLIDELHKLMKEKKYTFAYTAKAMNISSTALHLWLNGNYKGNVKKIEEAVSHFIDIEKLREGRINIDFVETSVAQDKEFICIGSYPKADGQTVVSICDLTQKMETMVSLLNEIESLNLNKAPFIVWYVTSEKEELVTAAKALNHFAIKGIKIFIFKAFLNDDKMGIECLLKPDLNDKKSYTRNENTPAKIFQKEYWEKYFEICDELQSEMQVNPKPQHFQYLPMGKRGVQIMQTVNTKLGYVATEIFINNDQTIFEKLSEHKVEIEEELGFLEWQPIEGKKSSRIRKTLGVDILKEGNIERAVKLHIQTAEDFKKVFSKYLV